MGVQSRVDWRRKPERRRLRGRIALLTFFLRVSGLVCESLWVQLAGQVFDGGNDAGSGAIHRVTNHRVAAIVHSSENLPPRERREPRHLAGGVSGMRLGKYQEIRLQTSGLFEIHLGPILRRIYDGNGSGMAKSVGEKSVFAGGNEGLRPNHKENVLRRQAGKVSLEIVETTLHGLGNRDASFRDTQHV